jgi:hypothetical protein
MNGGRYLAADPAVVAPAQRGEGLPAAQARDSGLVRHPLVLLDPRLASPPRTPRLLGGGQRAGQRHLRPNAIQHSQTEPTQRLRFP